MQLPSAFWHVDEVVVARTRISLQRICHYDVITALGLLFRRIVINAGVQPQRAFLLVTFEFISLCLPASDDHMSLFDRVSNVTRYPSMLLARARKSYLGKMRPLGQNGLPTCLVRFAEGKIQWRQTAMKLMMIRKCGCALQAVFWFFVMHSSDDRCPVRSLNVLSFDQFLRKVPVCFCITCISVFALWRTLLTIVSSWCFRASAKINCELAWTSKCGHLVHILK